MKLSVRLVGDEAVEQILQSLQTPTFLQPAFERIGAQLAYDLAEYPPERPGQTYRRTNTLGRSWTHREEVGMFRVMSIIGNNTPYAEHVQDAEQQAEVHQGRWQTTADVAEERLDWMKGEIMREIEVQIRRA